MPTDPSSEQADGPREEPSKVLAAAVIGICRGLNNAGEATPRTTMVVAIDIHGDTALSASHQIGRAGASAEHLIRMIAATMLECERVVNDTAKHINVPASMLQSLVMNEMARMSAGDQASGSIGRIGGAG